MVAESTCPPALEGLGLRTVVGRPPLRLGKRVESELRGRKREQQWGRDTVEGGREREDTELDPNEGEAPRPSSAWAPEGEDPLSPTELK